MGEFLKPWRRKIGVVTLVMACLFASGWVRTIGQANQYVSFTRNSFPIRDDQIIHYFGVTQDGFEWTTERAGGWKDYKMWMIPHRSTAIALTLLSAYLLLSKPRAAKPKADIQD